MSMPERDITGYARHMPALRAAEQLEAITVLQIGQGLMEREDARDVLERLQRAANYGSTPRSGAQRVTSGTEAMQVMSQMGVTVGAS